MSVGTGQAARVDGAAGPVGAGEMWARGAAEAGVAMSYVVFMPVVIISVVIMPVAVMQPVYVVSLCHHHVAGDYDDHIACHCDNGPWARNDPRIRNDPWSRHGRRAHALRLAPESVGLLFSLRQPLLVDHQRFYCVHFGNHSLWAFSSSSVIARICLRSSSAAVCGSNMAA